MWQSVHCRGGTAWAPVNGNTERVIEIGVEPVVRAVALRKLVGNLPTT